MGFDEAIFRCLSKYMVVNGRSRPSEFWWFMVLYFSIVSAAILILAISIDAAIFLLLLGALLTPPAIAVTVRRLHDIGISGWTLVFLIPVVGQVVLLAWLTRPSIARLNRFGAEPGKDADRFLLYAR